MAEPTRDDYDRLKQEYELMVLNTFAGSKFDKELCRRFLEARNAHEERANMIYFHFDYIKGAYEHIGGEYIQGDYIDTDENFVYVKRGNFIIAMRDKALVKSVNRVVLADETAKSKEKNI